MENASPVERDLARRHVVEVDQHQGVGEEDRVVQERLGDHQRRAEDRPPREPVEHQPQERQVAVPRLRHDLDRLRLIDRREFLPGLADLLLDLGHHLVGLVLAAVRDQPARALGQHPAHDDDEDGQHRAQQERQPPAHVGGEVVEEDVGDQRAQDRAGPVAAVDPDVDPAPVLRGHHLIDRGVDRRVLPADAHPGHEPGEVEEHQPAGMVPGHERGQPLPIRYSSSVRTNSRLRPRRSDILPNTSAPTISPTR